MVMGKREESVEDWEVAGAHDRCRGGAEHIRNVLGSARPMLPRRRFKARTWSIAGEQGHGRTVHG